ncbi:butyrophilin subfamily 3 member A1 [Gadus macrocephalus]|uniref:butyrophilin subfamily 3 member A1 n=1 Tax=Gadus macrocephalus TaxID=80720 RepID=UPI0028CB58E9|nr:butyrophilin subfamily 3 member A1 [Gadus macrocephalus]XP_059893500.1 butyrophilin subfamily 3 member A1 [Gadus macrocephalus]XP_059893501.1 butyrophilin subfamily 3 member A1 [Gadus macrocephalus]
MMKDCLQFLVEPAKKLKIRLKETRKRVRNDRKEPLVESQLFIMELARELNKMCQRSHVLSHIWTFEDSWPASVCRDFIVEWAAVIEKRVQPRLIQTESQAERTEKRDWKGHLLCMLEAGGEYEMAPHKRVILDWVLDVRSRPEASIWPGEPVLMMLDDLEFQWKRGRLPNLLPAMELIMLALLNAQSPEKEDVTKQWLVRKQRTQRIDAARYIPHSVWNWICEAAEDVLLDPDTANGDLLISDDAKRMRCGVEGGDAPCCARRFDGWRCAAARRGYASGRRYWEVEVGDRDWRLGVAKARAPRKGYRALNADSGYLTLRLERGSELKALTVPATPLAPGLAPPRRVGVYLDYEQGQLSFYDAQRRAHLYTYNERFTEELTPVFGTAEAMKDLVIRPAAVRGPCLCPGPCLWN